MYITARDFKNQRKLLASLMKGISIYSKRIARKTHKETDLNIVKTVEVELYEIYKIVESCSNAIITGHDLKTILDVNGALANVLSKLIDIYTDLKNKTYTRRVSDEEYEAYQKEVEETEKFVDDLIEGFDETKNIK